MVSHIQTSVLYLICHATRVAMTKGKPELCLQGWMAGVAPPHPESTGCSLSEFFGYWTDQEVFEFRFRFLYIDTVWMQGAIPACSDSHQETECLVCFCADIMKNNPLLVLMGLLQHHCLECAVHKVFAIMAISLSFSFFLSLII